MATDTPAPAAPRPLAKSLGDVPGVDHLLAAARHHIKRTRPFLDKAHDPSSVDFSVYIDGRQERNSHINALLLRRLLSVLPEWLAEMDDQLAADQQRLKREALDLAVAYASGPAAA